jgi:hypothetical protein
VNIIAVLIRESDSPPRPISIVRSLALCVEPESRACNITDTRTVGAAYDFEIMACGGKGNK